MATIEEMIRQADRKGWRLQNLSHIRNDALWSCIFERKKDEPDGRRRFAVSKLSYTATAAVESALANMESVEKQEENILKKHEGALTIALRRWAYALEVTSEEEYL